MKHLKVFTATIFFYFLINQSCSQSSGSAAGSKKTSFEATTPCTDEVRQLLNIPANIECGMMKWKLVLDHDDKDLPSAFELSYTYGEPKPATRGFKEGAQTTELKGNWTTRNRRVINDDDKVITLTPAGSAISISFLQPDQSILHLLNKNNIPMVGTAAWSFTLNNTNPSTAKPGSVFTRELRSTGIVSNTDTAAVFLGRTPCNESLRKLNNITADGCQLIKCKLILLQDRETQSPSNFVIQSIYVGKGDNRYSVSGKWRLTQGIPADPKAIVYHLLPDGSQPVNELLLLKAGDNLLFFINKDSQFLVGNDYCSYTLNRAN